MSEHHKYPNRRAIRSIGDLVTLEELYEADQTVAELPREIANVGMDIAHAAGDLAKEEGMLKSIEAVASRLSDEKSQVKQLWEARSSRAYTDCLERIRQATVRLAVLKAQKDGLYARKESALTRIEIWRTMQSTLRFLEMQEARQQSRQYEDRTYNR